MRSLLGRSGRILAALAVLAAGCRRAPAPANLVLVTVDTLRADHTTPYGYDRETTPVLARLAREGVRVDQAYAPMATTGPSHAALLTSRYPLSLGYLRNGQRLDEAHLTLAERLHAAGYRTSAFVSSFVLDRRLGFAQGFGTYDCRFERERATATMERWEGHIVPAGFDRRANETTDAALAWLARRGKDRPFFLWVHYFDPHHPYAPPAPYDRRFAPPPADTGLPRRAVALYDGEIAFTDHQLGRLLGAIDAEGPAARTLVVVTADHGEGLMQHGHMGHGLHLYEEAVRVPLVFRWPGSLPAGTVLPGPVEHVDLVPTVLDLLGVPRGGEGIEGQSLAAALRGQAGTAGRDPRRAVFLERRLYDTGVVSGFHVKGEKFAVRAGPWKYIEAPEEQTRELYDLRSDPGETRDLLAGQVATADLLARGIAGWRGRFDRNAHARDDSSRETQEALRALGYVQ
jgi:arylsulfatase A-like enzyme